MPVAPVWITGRIRLRYTSSVTAVREWPTGREISSRGTPLPEGRDTKP